MTNTRLWSGIFLRVNRAGESTLQRRYQATAPSTTSKCVLSPTGSGIKLGTFRRWWRGKDDRVLRVLTDVSRTLVEASRPSPTGIWNIMRFGPGLGNFRRWWRGKDDRVLRVLTDVSRTLVEASRPSPTGIWNIMRFGPGLGNFRRWWRGKDSNLRSR